MFNDEVSSIYIYTGAKYVLCNEVSWCIIAPEAVKSAAIQLSSHACWVLQSMFLMKAGFMVGGLHIINM